MAADTVPNTYIAFTRVQYVADPLIPTQTTAWTDPLECKEGVGFISYLRADSASALPDFRIVLTGVKLRVFMHLTIPLAYSSTVYSVCAPSSSRCNDARAQLVSQGLPTSGTNAPKLKVFCGTLLSPHVVPTASEFIRADRGRHRRIVLLG